MTETIAIIVGASEWPKSNNRWPASECFRHSANEFKRYLYAADGICLETDDVLDIFNDPRPASEIDEAIDSFIQNKIDQNGEKLRNIVFFYTGHGAFTETDQKYCIALRSTRIAALGQSAYRAASIARTLNRNTSALRKFVILDCCYAAAGLGDFLPQSDAASRMEEDLMDALVESGTALLCASSSADVALAPRDEKFTMFSGALLHSLSHADERRSSRLSLEDIAEISTLHIRRQFKEMAVRPEVHVPDKRRGDLSSLPFFPIVSLLPAGESEKVPHKRDSKISADSNSQSSLIKLSRIDRRALVFGAGIGGILAPVIYYFKGNEILHVIGFSENLPEGIILNQRSGIFHHVDMCANHCPSEANISRGSVSFEVEKFHRANLAKFALLIAKREQSPLAARLLVTAISYNPLSTHLYKPLIGIWGKNKDYKKIHKFLDANIKYLRTLAERQGSDPTRSNPYEKALKELQTRKNRAEYLATLAEVSDQ